MSTPLRPALLEIEGPPPREHEHGLFSAAEQITEDPVDASWQGTGVTHPVICDPTLPALSIPCLTEEEVPGGLFTAFRAEYRLEADTEYIDFTLLERDPRYGDTPLLVTVGERTYRLDPVARQARAPRPVEGTEEFPVTMTLAGPAGTLDCVREFEVQAPATGQESGVITCEANPQGPATERPWAPGVVSALPWSVEGDVTCRPPGRRTEQELEAVARQRLAVAEQATAERRFQVEQFADAIVVAQATFEDAWSLCEGVGLLEHALGVAGVGAGVLHAPRVLAAPMVSGRLALPGPDGPGGRARLRAPLGEPWAFGAGYVNAGPDGVPAPEGQAWLWATGPVSVRRTAVRLLSVLDPRRNERRVRVDRSYVVTAASCEAYAVLVKIPEC